ncbi:MAG: hypothetical protein KVP17_001645 [Porospora cf. gigantea B]|uniref:uncharacterized protein n=1 Tax=Porospora cf. gigantea B TaxID=2853592 RepID=UPI003571EBB1|nr:MAG: hypothetical protein KVP17_001645 [Porospora cf. gigantea B]
MLWFLAGVASGVVLQLDMASFQPTLAEGPTVVMYYGHDCPHCADIQPVFEEVSNRLAEKATFAAVDVFKHQDVADEQGILEVPSFKLYDGVIRLDFDEQPDEQSLVRFVDSGTSVGYTEVASRAEALKVCSDVCFLYRGGGDFLRAAVKTNARNHGMWFWLAGSSVKEELEMVYGRGEQFRAVPIESTPPTAEALEVYRVPLLPGFEEWGHRLMSTGRNITVAVGPRVKVEATRKLLEAFAQEVQSNAIVVTLYSESSEETAKDATAGKTDFALVVPAETGRYLLPLPADVDVMVDFVAKAFDGTGEVVYMSEPAPPQSNEVVQRLVGSTFQSVFSDEKDFLLLVTGNPCQNCESLTFSLAELGRQRGDSLVVGTLDGNLNEIPVDGFDFWEFPSLFLIKKGKRFGIACVAKSEADLEACADSKAEEAVAQWDLMGDETGLGFDNGFEDGFEDGQYDEDDYEDQEYEGRNDFNFHDEF